jgi:alpha-glucosidase
MSLLGFAYWTPDVFGLDGKTTPETHMRYAQWALLAPVARYFWRPSAVDDTRFPWSHNTQVEANFRACVALRYQLLPYYYALAWEAYRLGLPIVRPLMLEFQAEARLAAVDDQFMLGSHLLVAPVLEAEAVRRRIILPAGVWHDFWSTQSYTGGGEVDYPAPLERLPILVRGGAVVPLGPALNCIPDAHQFSRLQLHFWPPYPTQGVIYDDDGGTRAYERGAGALTRITVSAQAQQIEVCLSAAEGDFPGLAQTREIEFVFQRTVAPSAVSVNQQPVPWQYAAAQQTVRFSAVCTVKQTTVITLTL